MDHFPAAKVLLDGECVSATLTGWDGLECVKEMLEREARGRNQMKVKYIVRISPDN